MGVGCSSNQHTHFIGWVIFIKRHVFDTPWAFLKWGMELVSMMVQVHAWNENFRGTKLVIVHLTTNYANATIMRWGHDFLRIRGWYSKLGSMGKIQMSKGEPIQLSTTFLVLFTQSFITASNWLSLLLHGMGKVWKSKFEFEKLSVFGKHVLTLWASKNQKISSHSLMHPCFWSS